MLPGMRPEDLLQGAAIPSFTAAGRLADPLVVLDLDGHLDWGLAKPIAFLMAEPHVPVIGLATTPLPEEAAPLLEALTLTIAPGGPGRAWVDGDADALIASIRAAPQAAFTTTGLLRLTARTSITDGLTAESMAYSLLLGGREFAAWRATRPRRPIPEDTEPPVLIERIGDVLRIQFNRPARRNAFSAGLRNAFLEALALAEADPSITQVDVTGAGPSFCAGGDLDEFGSAEDLVAAHAVRLRASAGLAISRMADRVRPVLHGACVGAGIEVPSFANCVAARPGTWFQLPELRMGLLPGAGGTVGITRRIGRWRTAYLAVSGSAIDLGTALSWGLVDERA
jgi:enoyl-CoA hydratase/carnithine racemase